MTGRMTDDITEATGIPTCASILQPPIATGIRQENQISTTAMLTGKSIHRQRGKLQQLTVQGKGLVPTSLAVQKLGSGPLLRALPRDPRHEGKSRFA